MDFEVAKKIFDALYANVSGYDLSAAARRRLPYVDKSFTYGEVTTESFYKILSAAEPREGEIFYDLGSGTGKAVILAALLFPFSKVIGIEKLKDLWRSSQEVISKLPMEFRQNKTIAFVHADFLESDFSDADVVFIHSTCFLDELMAHLEHKLSLLKQGARIVTVTKPLTAEIFHLQKQEEYQLSWGKATVYIYKLQDVDTGS